MIKNLPILNSDKSFSKLLLEITKIFKKRQLNQQGEIDINFLSIF